MCKMFRCLGVRCLDELMCNRIFTLKNALNCLGQLSCLGIVQTPKTTSYSLFTHRVGSLEDNRANINSCLFVDWV